MDNKITQNKAEILKALAHPTRLNILESLRRGERCVCEIIDDVNIEQSNVSQHLAVLKKIGILTHRKDGLRVIYKVKHDEIFKILSLLDSLISRQMEETMAILDGLRQKRAGSN
ncbi:MAG: metalloregulator ArsR/SmtB family transcription factor [Firmicutes bacterium]|nr:metalloregulator ArsR/SmtB family transcription factor [Bacillota bacterium]